MALLPATGTLSYNGVTFTSLVSSRISGKPVLDEAGRTVKYVAWTIDVRSYVIADGSGFTDVPMEDIRKKLTTPGKALVYKNKGFGDLSVNVDGNIVRDVNWGPTPDILEWTPIGNNRTALITWRCTTYIPECDFANYQFALMSVNYETEFEIDVNGLTVIHITGYLEIPMTRVAPGGIFIPDTADNYRERIHPDVPLGFRREQQTFRLSKNKSRLDFAIVDKELPVPLPDKTTQITCEHSLESSFQRQGMIGGFVSWRGHISASITVPHGVNKAQAANTFFGIILLSRIKPNIGAGTRGDENILPESLSIREDVFGLTTHFLFSYILTGRKLDTILAQSGLWKPIDGTNFSSWKSSLLSTSFAIRGTSGIRHTSDQDALVDLCGNLEAVIALSGTAAVGPEAFSILSASQAIDAQKSWLTFENNFELDEQDRICIHKPLTALVTEETPAANTDPINGSLKASLSVPKAQVTTSSSSPDVIQRISASTYIVRMFGFAMRLGFRVSVPTLTSFGGVTPKQRKQNIVEKIVGMIAGTPIFQTEWTIEYSLALAPISTPVFSNPMLNATGIFSDQPTNPPGTTLVTLN